MVEIFIAVTVGFIFFNTFVILFTIRELAQNLQVEEEEISNLDEAIDQLNANDKTLSENDEALANEILKLKEDIKQLQELHGINNTIH